MMAPTTPILIVMAAAILVLNWYAFRSDAAAAGHGRRQKLQMAAIWLTIIVGLAFLIQLVGL